MIGITQAQYDEAMDAVYALEQAADLVEAAVKMLCAVPERFKPQMHEAMDSQFDGELAGNLSALASRIALDADNAAERTE